jgi:hypothetical protein
MEGGGMMLRGLVMALVLSSAVGVSTGCSKKHATYRTNVELRRIDVVGTDASGKPAQLDVEFGYSDCPGNQVEVLRGATEFAACMAGKKVGEKVPVVIDWHWTDEGRYDWDVTEMGGCARPPGEDDEASFDTVQECTPLLAHGAPTGFRCNRLPQASLIAKCPWFQRH